MSPHVGDLLPEFVLGTLGPVDNSRVEAHLPRCPSCSSEATAIAESLTALTLELHPIAPPPALKTRLLSLVGQQAQGAQDGLAARFAARLARFFDVGVERARELVAQLTDPAAWSPGPCEGISLFHLQGGPLVAGADVGFVRLVPGARFPHHTHGGDEVGILLKGGYQDSDGQEYRAGDSAHAPAGSDHDFVALPGEDCIFAVVVFGGVAFDNGFKF